ncbi:hypothetical protein MKW94_024354, partial [Papaver nudicaule]|nr:hypothetical protein [Papaver nudicaule]
MNRGNVPYSVPFPPPSVPAPPPPPPPTQSPLYTFSAFFPERVSGPWTGNFSSSIPNQNNGMMRPPSGAPPHSEQGMAPLAMRPPPPAQGAWPSYPPAQMMNQGIVNNNPRPLDLGKFPPWQLTVTLPSGENRYIDIPYLEGNHVTGLPLGSGVPEVIASNYKALLCMVSGMTCIITNQTSELDRYQKNAARYWDDVNRYRLELQ